MREDQRYALFLPYIHWNTTTFSFLKPKKNLIIIIIAIEFISDLWLLRIYYEICCVFLSNKILFLLLHASKPLVTGLTRKAELIDPYLSVVIIIIFRLRCFLFVILSC